MSWPLTARSRPERLRGVGDDGGLVGRGPLARPEPLDGLVAADGLGGRVRSPARNRWTASWLSGGWAATAVAELRTASMAPSTIPRMSFDMGSSLVGGGPVRGCGLPAGPLWCRTAACARSLTAG